MDALTITGKPVTYHFFPGESFEVSHGEFIFRNSSDSVITTTIERCDFLDNTIRTRLNSFFVYHDEDEIGKTFSIKPRSFILIHVTFAARIAIPELHKKYAVSLYAIHDNKHYEAECEIEVFEEKYP